jgi:hypothetical protein
MKTIEKLGAGWLLVLGFMFMTQTASAIRNKNIMLQTLPPSIEEERYGNPDFVNTDALYQLEGTIQNGIIFGVPTLTLGGWLALSLYRQNRHEKKVLKQQASENLQSLFYQMIQQNKGRITVLGFAMQSELPAARAKQFLDDRAKEFNANFKVSEDGGVSYHFDV